MSLLTDIEIIGLYHKYKKGIAQEERIQFALQPNLTAALKTAGKCNNNQGQRYPHQRRLSVSTLVTAEQVMIDNTVAIKECENFDQLYDLLEQVLKNVDGIGEMYVYDIALRIGFFLRLRPDKVYLHIGTRLGVKALKFNISSIKAIKREDILKLHPGLEILDTYELEDILCQFKRDFENRPLHAHWFKVKFKYRG